MSKRTWLVSKESGIATKYIIWNDLSNFLCLTYVGKVHEVLTTRTRPHYLLNIHTLRKNIWMLGFYEKNLEESYENNPIAR